MEDITRWRHHHKSICELCCSVFYKLITLDAIRLRLYFRLCRSTCVDLINGLIFCPSWSCTIIYFIILLDSLHCAKSSLTWVSSISFLMLCAPFSMLGRTRLNWLGWSSFSVYGDWDRRDVSEAGICDCVKECMSFVM